VTWALLHSGFDGFLQFRFEWTLDAGIQADSLCHVDQAIDSEGSPYPMVLDYKGTVIHEGDFSDVEFWDMLALVCRVS
jgi:hypothetical protein